MEIHENGYRFNEYYKWEDVKNQPYNYARDGLIKKLLSSHIVNTKNKILKYILSYFEYSLIYMMKTADILKNFKNFNWKNR